MIVIDVQISASKFPVRGWVDGPSALLSEKLHPIANSQDGNVKVEDVVINLRSLFLSHAGRAAGKNEPFGMMVLDVLYACMRR